MNGALCSAKLRNVDPCRSVATDGEFCAYHAALAAELGSAAVANGDHAKMRNARQRLPVVAEAEPLELSTSASSSPSAVRPALALTAAEEVETIRCVLLEAATSTTRETWATCTCPECGKGFRQEISVPDHSARIKAVETLLREGLGRVGEAEVIEPKVPTTVDEVKDLSMDELALVIALSCANEIRAVVDQGDGALHLELERGEPDTRDTLARALAEVGCA
jgi:hypothetical protein